MKITILWGKTKPDSYFIKLLSVLEDSLAFQYFVSICRKKCKLPQSGLSLKLIVRDNKHLLKFSKTNARKYNCLFNNKKKFNTLFKCAETIREIYNLPEYWRNTFIFIILSNIVIPHPIEEKDKFEIDYIGGLESLSYLVKTGIHKEEIRIIIKENMSIEDIKKYIDKNSKTLHRFLSYLPVPPNKLQSLIKQKNLDIKKIIRRGKQKGLSYKEIYFIIINKAGKADNVSFALTKQSLSTYQKRYAEFLASLIKDKYMFRLITEK